MSYKCRICGVNDVEHPGDVCEMCGVGQEPYASVNTDSNGYDIPRQDTCSRDAGGYTPGNGSKRKIWTGPPPANTDPYGNEIVPQEDDPGQVYDTGQAAAGDASAGSAGGTGGSGNTKTGTGPKAAGGPRGALTSGIIKNINVDTQRKSILAKLFMALFRGIPFTFYNEITMFQVFPDFTGKSTNALGNACDQVLVYGRVKTGSIAENNEVEIYGHRDGNNNIIAKRIFNKASGTTVTPEGVIPVAVIWGIIIAVFIAVAAFLATCGV